MRISLIFFIRCLAYRRFFSKDNTGLLLIYLQTSHSHHNLSMFLALLRYPCIGNMDSPARRAGLILLSRSLGKQSKFPQWCRSHYSFHIPFPSRFSGDCRLMVPIFISTGPNHLAAQIRPKCHLAATATEPQKAVAITPIQTQN